MNCKTLLILSTGVAACFSNRVQAIPITVDLPPPLTFLHFLSIPLAGISSTLSPGQTLFVDVSFANEQFLRVLPENPSLFTAGYFFNNERIGGITGSVTLSAYFLGPNGEALNAPQSHVDVISGQTFTGVGSGISTLTPLDFYGIHFDITSNLNSSLQITGAGLIFADYSEGGFVVGPVPDGDITLPLLGISSAALLALRRIATC